MVTKVVRYRIQKDLYIICTQYKVSQDKKKVGGFAAHIKCHDMYQPFSPKIAITRPQKKKREKKKQNHKVVLYPVNGADNEWKLRQKSTNQFPFKRKGKCCNIVLHKM